MARRRRVKRANDHYPAKTDIPRRKPLLFEVPLRRLANIGIGHGAIDGGVGYTYLNSDTGIEFSAVTGLTYNFTNPKTDYKSGVDWHLDWGASLFLSKQMHVGVVGYFYDQLTADSGAGDKVEAFKSRVVGVGPQVGYSLPVGRNEAYVNFKGYKEFNADNRPDGWNAQLAFAISLGGPSSGGGQTSTPLK